MKDLEHEELSGNSEGTGNSSMNYSETDDDEDEGVGGGTMGRSVHDPEEE